MAITGAIRRISTEKLYHELGFINPLEIGDGTGNTVACTKYSTANLQSTYLFEIISTLNRSCITIIHNFFRNSLQKLFTVLGWNKRDLTIRKSENVRSFKNKLLQFICPSCNNTFTYHNPKGVQ